MAQYLTHDLAAGQGEASAQPVSVAELEAELEKLAQYDRPAKKSAPVAPVVKPKKADEARDEAKPLTAKEPVAKESIAKEPVSKEPTAKEPVSKAA